MFALFSSKENEGMEEMSIIALKKFFKNPYLRSENKFIF